MALQLVNLRCVGGRDARVREPRTLAGIMPLRAG
jgi:hypothetical protein